MRTNVISVVARKLEARVNVYIDDTMSHNEFTPAMSYLKMWIDSLPTFYIIGELLLEWRKLFNIDKYTDFVLSDMFIFVVYTSVIVEWSRVISFVEE